MNTQIKYSVCLLLFLTALLAPLLVCPSQEEEVDDTAIFVERIHKSVGGAMEKCPYCGRVIKTGPIQRDAEETVLRQVEDALSQNDIPFTDDKDSNRRLNIFIYRYAERKGGNYAVEKPAGVGLHMHLYENNALKRVFMFDEDQEALMDNLLSIGKFLRRGGRWITVEALSEEAIEKGIETLSEDLE